MGWPSGARLAIRGAAYPRALLETQVEVGALTVSGILAQDLFELDPAPANRPVAVTIADP